MQESEDRAALQERRIEELEKRVSELENFAQSLIHQLPQALRMGINQAVQASANSRKPIRR